LPDNGCLRPKHVAMKTQPELRLIILLILYCCVDVNFTIIRGLWYTTGCTLWKYIGFNHSFTTFLTNIDNSDLFSSCVLGKELCDVKIHKSKKFSCRLVVDGSGYDPDLSWEILKYSNVKSNLNLKM
jgi:hypothetical protein